MTAQILARLAFLCVCFLAAGCQTYSLVQPARVTVGDKLSIEPDIAWNKRSIENAEIWTVDGEALQALHLYKGLEDGDTLFVLTNSEKQEKMPQYSKTMSLLELREFIEASIVQSGFTNLKSLKFKPTKFADKDGFRFEFTFSNTNGLRELGFAAGAQSGDRLYLVLYRGAKLHYYGKYLKNVEDMIRSVQLAWASAIL